MVVEIIFAWPMFFILLPVFCFFNPMKNTGVDTFKRVIGKVKKHSCNHIYDNEGLSRPAFILISKKLFFLTKIENYQ